MRAAKTSKLVLLILILLIPACSPKPKSPPPKRVSVKLATQPLLLNMPGYIAQDEGFFDDQDLDVEFLTVGRGLAAEVIPPLSTGDIDVATSAASFALFNSIKRGIDVKVVAEKGSYGSDPEACSDSALMARKELVDNGELKTVSDLKGRKVGVNRETSDGQAVNELLKTAGLTLKDVQETPLPFNARVDALLGGSVDVSLSGEPQITQLVESGRVVAWQHTREFLGDATVGILVFGPNLLKKDTDAGDRFVAAYLKGMAQFQKGATKRNVEITAKYTELDPALLGKVCWGNQDPKGEVNWPSVAKFQTYGIEGGFLDGEITEDQFWTRDFLRRAAKIDNE